MNKKFEFFSIKFFKNLFFIILIISTTNLYADTKPLPNNQSLILLHDGFFADGLPVKFELDEKKTERWGWGNWSSKQGYGNFNFVQTGPGRILTESGMRAKNVLKNWGVENYNLGKKKGFKSSVNRAFIQLVKINNQNCAVVISNFSQSGSDALNRNRTTIEGYICKYNNEITLEEGKNIMHCIELKGQRTHFVGKNIDEKCVKKLSEKKESKKTNDKKISKYLYCQDSDGVYEYLTGNDTCYDGQKKITKSKYLKLKKEFENNKNQDSFEERLTKLKSLFEKKLITKEEYDQERKEILDEM